MPHLSAHMERHTAQINEVKTHGKSPKPQGQLRLPSSPRDACTLSLAVAVNLSGTEPWVPYLAGRDTSQQIMDATLTAFAALGTISLGLSLAQTKCSFATSAPTWQYCSGCM